jgi:hypothetical protein
MTDRWHLADGDFGASPEHRPEVLRDVAQRGNAVSPRAREQEPAAVEPAEIGPLNPSPRFLESRERPSPCHMQLSQIGHVPHALCDVAAGVEYAPAKLGDLAAYAVVKDKGAQAAAEEPELGYALGCQLGYPRLDVRPQPRDQLGKDRRVGFREDGCRRLVRDNVVTVPEEPPYRETHLVNRRTVRADEN